MVTSLYCFTGAAAALLRASHRDVSSALAEAPGLSGGCPPHDSWRAMKIDGSVALVTGAGRGLGRAFARELVSRGAARVYGAARDPAAVTEPGVTPVALDITDSGRVARVAEQ